MLAACFDSLAALALAGRGSSPMQAFSEIGAVIKPCMVCCNQVRQQPTRTAAGLAMALLQRLECVKRPGCRMRLIRGDQSTPFDVGIRVLPDVALKAWPELTKVVPKAGEGGPFSGTGWSASGGALRNVAKMFQ